MLCILGVFVCGCGGIGDSSGVFTVTSGSSSSSSDGGSGGSGGKSEGGFGGMMTVGTTSSSNTSSTSEASSSSGGGGFSQTCFDHIKNQDETDVDCGGKTCSPCPETESCLKNEDCVSLDCENLFCKKCVVKNTIQGPRCDLPGLLSSVTQEEVPYAQCINDVCVGAGCYGNFSNCNGDWLDGCEVNTDSNPAACGASCVPCKPGQICAGNKCE